MVIMRGTTSAHWRNHVRNQKVVMRIYKWNMPHVVQIQIGAEYEGEMRRARNLIRLRMGRPGSPPA